MNPQIQRVLILMSDTGGGHRSAAEAIAGAVEREFPGRYQVKLVDAIARAARFPFNHTPGWYLPAITYAEFWWGVLFHWTDHPGMRRFLLAFLNWAMHRGLERLLRAEPADLVVSVHPLLTTVPRRVLRKIGSPAPFVIVVTDLFDAHMLWFDHDADLCLVPTDGAYQTACRFGMAEDRLRVVGLPVSMKFLDSGTDKAAQRADLGLLQDTTTVLLVGGGEGMGKLAETAQAISGARLPVQLVIIAGRNKALQRRLLAASWQIPVTIQGFVTNMPDWMHAADVLITKAGPGTISEGIACGLPILLSGFLPGQEEGNVRFVQENAIGVLRQKPEEIAETLREWLLPDNAALAHMSARARELGRPRAALDIAAILDGVRDKPTFPRVLNPRESRL